MTKQVSTVGYVSISGRKIAAILLILICSFALAWATRSGRDASVKPLVAHTNQASMRGRPVSPANHNHSKAADKAHTHQGQGALSTFNEHVKKSSRARQSKGAGQGANQGAGGGSGGDSASMADQGAGQGGAHQGAGQGAKPKSDETPSPTPEESPGLTSDTTLGLSATITGTSRWPSAAATPSGLTGTSRWPRAAATPMPSR